MRFRTPLLTVCAVTAASLVAAGCGSSDSDSKDSAGPKVGGQTLLVNEQYLGPGKDGKKGTKDDEEGDPKVTQLVAADKAFKKDAGNLDACRNLANSWIVYASPESVKKPGDQPELPKDRDKSLKQAQKVLESCVNIKKDENVTQMLASVYMATGEAKQAAPLLKQIAKDRKNDPNAYYSWGLAESGAGNSKGVVAAWTEFLKYVDKKDPRIKSTKDSIKALKAEIAAKKK